MHTRSRYRSIWVSDVHLGTRDCKADYLLQFLRSHDADHLYLVGDIFDGWALRRSWYWRRQYDDILRTILRKSQRGTNVVYIPGNHDEFARDFLYVRLGGITIHDHYIHETGDGRRFLVLHGDQFDGVIRYARWLALLGSHAYQLVLRLNHWVNYWRDRFGRPYWSLSAFLKYNSKRATQFVSRFEHALAAEASRHGVDGVICGHIHHAELRRIGDVEYANSGDWVESCTALVEEFDGRLNILHYVDQARTARRAHTSGDGVPVGSSIELSDRLGGVRDSVANGVRDTLPPDGTHSRGDDPNVGEECAGHSEDADPIARSSRIESTLSPNFSI